MVGYAAGPSVGQGSVFAKSDVGPFIPEIWEAVLMRSRTRMMELMRYVDVFPFSGGQGDTLKRPFIGRLRSRRKVAGKPLLFEAKQDGQWEMVVDRLAYAAISIDRKANFFSQIDIARAYAPEMMRALMEDIEYSLLAERATFAGFGADSNIVSNAPITYADMLDCYRIMLERDIPPTELVWHIGPRQFITMFTLDQFIQSGVYNSGNIANIQNGTIVGTVLGVPVVLNHNIRRNSFKDGPEPLVLGGEGYEDVEGGEAIATPGMDDSSPYWPTQYGDDRYNITPTALTEGGVSALLTTRSSIKVAMAMNPVAYTWFNEDYWEDRTAALQLYDIKTALPKEGLVLTTDEYNVLP